MDYQYYASRFGSGPNEGKIAIISRIARGENRLATERWDLPSGAWIDDPDVLGRVGGMIEGEYYEEISEQEANEFIEGKRGKNGKQPIDGAGKNTPADK